MTNGGSWWYLSKRADFPLFTSQNWQTSTISKYENRSLLVSRSTWYFHRMGFSDRLRGRGEAGRGEEAAPPSRAAHRLTARCQSAGRVRRGSSCNRASSPVGENYIRYSKSAVKTKRRLRQFLQRKRALILTLIHSYKYLASFLAKLQQYQTDCTACKFTFLIVPYLSECNGIFSIIVTTVWVPPRWRKECSCAPWFGCICHLWAKHRFLHYLVEGDTRPGSHYRLLQHLHTCKSKKNNCWIRYSEL